MKRTSQKDISRRLASEFLSRFFSSGDYARSHVERLAQMALSADEQDAKEATAAIFTSIVEPLADSFDPAAVTLYNRFFAQLIQAARSAPQGAKLDPHLNSFGIRSERDLISRAERLRRARQDLRRRAEKIAQAIVLSRVTLGADVAITSVIIERLKQALPHADITLVGGRKAAELLGGAARLSFRELNYDRTGTLPGRLLSWIDLLDATRALTRGLDGGSYLIVDTDSRLSQLGLLPLIEPDGERGAESSDYLFFPSREYGHATSRTLGQLASLWLNDLFGEADILHPRLSLAVRDREAARELSRKIKQPGSRKLVAINFGVGENPLKRIGDYFEKMLVSRLIEEGAVVILDRGAGEEESMRADAIIRHASSLNAEGRSVRVLELNEANLYARLSSAAGADLIVWQGRIGLLAALIGESDLYVGYDSAGQHIASALAVPCLDIFAGFSSPRMLDRWRPSGEAEARIIAVDTVNAVADCEAALSDAISHAREMLKRA